MILAAILKVTGGKFSLPKLVFQSLDDNCIVGMAKDPETGDVVLELYEGRAADVFRMQRGMNDAEG